MVPGFACMSAHGSVPVGLVEVDEDALAAFLLPPVRSHFVRHAPLKLPGGSDHGVADVQELTGWFNGSVDVQAAVS